MNKTKAFSASAALMLMATTAFGQFKTKTPVASKNTSKNQIVISSSDSNYEPVNLQMNEGDTFAIDIQKLNSASNTAVYGPFVGSAGPCGFSSSAYNQYKQVQGFNLAAALLTIKENDGSQKIVSLCDAVQAADKSADGKTAYLIADHNYIIQNAFVNEGRQVINGGLFTAAARPIDNNSGSITIDYKHMKHQ